jgi:hypothetical protein
MSRIEFTAGAEDLGPLEATAFIAVPAAIAAELVALLEKREGEAAHDKAAELAKAMGGALNVEHQHADITALYLVALFIARNAEQSRYVDASSDGQSLFLPRA